MNLEDFEFSTRFLMQGKKHNMPVMLWYTKKPSPRPALSFGTDRGHGGCSGYGTNRTDLLWLLWL